MEQQFIVISPPNTVPQEQNIVIELFKSGLQKFHLRKPDFSDVDLAQYLSQLPTEYWRRIVLHHHYHLAEQLGLGGVHLTENSRKEKTQHQILQTIEDFRAEGLSISAAVHDIEAIDFLGQHCDYLLVSPIFDSISKPNYLANSTLDVRIWQGKIKAQLIALGGITNENMGLAVEKGFDGVAVLGFIWNNPEKAVEHYHRLLGFQPKKRIVPISTTKRPYVLSIAGHDPSAGAGLTADIKTMEQYEVYGLSVCTALTIQNDQIFERVEWVSEATILEQIEILKHRFEIVAAKVGLIENWAVLEKITQQLENVPIVFDPILKASAGFMFHPTFDKLEILKRIHLITPNAEELLHIFPNTTTENAAQKLSEYCAVLLKGGHRKEKIGVDELWQQGKLIASFKPTRNNLLPKHGSGCVLSAAIASELAKGSDLINACANGKYYIERFLASNETLLGYHFR